MATAAVKGTVAKVEEGKVEVKEEETAAAKEVAAKGAGREEETEVDSAVGKEEAKAVVDLEVVDLEVVMEKAKEEARGKDSVAGSVAGSAKVQAEEKEEATAGAKVADSAVEVKEEEV